MQDVGSRRERLPGEPYETAADYPRDRSIHELFEEQAVRSPNAVALVLGEQQWTYRQLNRRANRLAHYLRRCGVGRETLVGLCLERSPELPLALLGILKAGGAYLPLDPEYPHERLQWMVRDGRLKWILTKRREASTLQDVGASLIYLDEGAWEEEPEHDPARINGPEDLAYVMYTSGSTGEPKGVSIVHRGVVRLVKGANYADLGEDQVFLQLAPTSFDASTLEIWGSLLNGARLVILEPGRPTLKELGSAIRRHGVTTLWLAANLFHLMVEEELDSLRGVKQLLAGGDVLSPEHVRRVLETCPGVTVINGYGPTENTTFTCCHRMQNPGDLGEGAVPIGRPVSNTRVYILDEQGAPVQAGVVGELYAGGDGLARGYWERPELTTERFVEHRIGDTNDRLYRTGDLVRCRPDGIIEFIGRRDHQVKIRGYRVELGEIETVLRNMEEVKGAVVACEPGPDSERHLVAYVVPRPGADLSSGSLRTALSEKLPDYMLPSVTHFVDDLPLTPSGKVDRAALSAVRQRNSGSETHLERPDTTPEGRLARIWKDCLALKEIDRRANFFELGGHSLLAARVVARIADVFQIELPLRAVFENPTLIELAKLVTGQAGRQEKQPQLRRIGWKDKVPLSFGQEQLWFLEQLGVGPGTYNVVTGTRLKGELAKEALTQALKDVVGRHEVLRTVYRAEDGVPHQTVESLSGGFELQEEDLRGCGPMQREDRVRGSGLEEATRGFDLERGPIVRSRLLRLDEAEWALWVAMHHIASDGWSLSVFWEELSALYGRHVRGDRSGLEKLPLQYADYAIWQRERLTGTRLTQHLAYWTEELAHLPALELPTDRRRSPKQRHRGGRCAFELAEGVADRLRRLSRAEGATSHMALMAGFEILLFRYTRQEDFGIGVPFASRNRPELEGLIGFFVDTLVIRATVGSEWSLRKVLRGVKEKLLEAQLHQEVPFEKVVKVLQPERDLSRNPLFQVVFGQEDAEQWQLEGLEGRRLEVEAAPVRFDLEFDIRENATGIRGEILYDRDLFEAETIGRMADHYARVLEAASLQPDEVVDDLDLLGEAEQRRLVMEWNDTEHEYPRDRCIHELFEEQVEREPEAPVVVFKGERLTYRELNERADRLAAELRGYGVMRETVVGVCLDRSVELVIALLGILKAGGAYLPLDPEFPGERLGFMLQDSEALFVITRPHSSKPLGPENASGNSLRFSRLGLGAEDGALCLYRTASGSSAIVRQRAEPLHHTSPPSSHQLAYLMYTSGSTGKPKGVQIEHQSVVNLLYSVKERLQVTSADALLAVTTLSFDISVLEIFLPLVSGGRVVIAPAEAVADGPELGRLLTQYGATLMQATPATWRLMIESGWQGHPGLTILCGGETLPTALASRLLQCGEAVWNLYGPTETTIWSATARVASSKPVTIGRPLANTTIFILDDRLRPLPIGLPGELYIGGDGVSRGYWKQPALTAEKFIPDSFGGNPGKRLYRTGDLARFRNDGEIEFLGRLDQQVKIRGFRIELGEVEATLREHPSISEAVAATSTDEQGGAILIAYVFGNGNWPVTASSLRTFLESRLPDYMVPSRIVPLERIPRTPNGKIDRKALPEVSAGRGQLGVTYCAPRNHVEQLLAAIWKRYLSLEQIGIDDDFFSLGGYSLLAARVVTRTASVFDCVVPVRTIFEHPTIRRMSGWLQSLQPGSGETPPIQRHLRRSNFPLSFGQEQLWFLEQLGIEAGTYNIVTGVRLKGDLQPEALEQALQNVVTRHDVLRTVYGAENGVPFQSVLAPGAFVLQREDLRECRGEERGGRVREAGVEEATRGFDLELGPVLRGRLLRMDENEWVLWISMHHIASDGWSLGVFWRELTELYETFEGGGEPPRAEPDIQYGDFALWQRARLEHAELQSDLEYWRKELMGVPLLELPTDRRRPAVRGYRGGRHRFEVSDAVTRRLKELSLEEGTTLYTTSLAGFQLLLHRHTGQSDFGVGMPVANRNRRELEGLIGFFVNMVVVRANLEDQQSFRGLLRAVKENVIEAQAHEELPFEKLVEELQPERDLSRNPLVQVVFAQQEELETPLSALGGEWLEADAQRARFDLECHVKETKGRLKVDLWYSRDLFETETIERMADLYCRLLDLVSRAPDTQLAALNGANNLGPRRRAEETAFGGVANRAPESRQTVSKRETGYVEPRTDLERLLADLWAECLGVERIGVEDDFFACGGHSLLALRLMARIRAALGFEIPLRKLFENPVISSLAEALAEEEPRPGHASAVAALYQKISALSEAEASERLHSLQSQEDQQ